MWCRGGSIRGSRGPKLPATENRHARHDPTGVSGILWGQDKPVELAIQAVGVAQSRRPRMRSDTRALRNGRPDMRRAPSSPQLQASAALDGCDEFQTETT